MKGFVYIIESENLYKIGKSKNPHKRIKQLQTGSERVLNLKYFKVVEDMLKAEQILHTLFNCSRKHGEWFKLTKTDLELLEKIFKENNLTEDEQKRLKRMGLI